MQNHKGTNISVSESEKLVMTAAGCNVPIKKRWFLIGSPCLPPMTQCTEEPEGFHGSQHGSYQNINMNSTIECKKNASDDITSVDINCTGVAEKNTNYRGDDHSGISVLANVACNSNSSEEYVSEGPVVAGIEEVPIKTELTETKISTTLLSDQQPCSSMALHAPVKTEHHDDFNIPVVPSEDLHFETIYTHVKDHVLENINHDASRKIISESHDISNKENSDESVRDGRLHWDLNTSMDAWDCPLNGDEQVDDKNRVDTNSLDIDHRQADAPTPIVSGAPKSEGKHCVSNTNLNVRDFPRAIGDAYNSTERALAPLEFKSLSVEAQGTEEKDLKLDTKNIDISNESSSFEIKKTSSACDKDRSNALPMPLFSSTHVSARANDNVNPHASQGAASDPYVAPSLSFDVNTEYHPSEACERVAPIVLVDKTIHYTRTNITGREKNNVVLSDLTVDDEKPFNKESFKEDGYHNDIYAIDLRMDCDSQYEDGELRESSLHDWEEDDGEELDIDRVDYGSDNRETNTVGSENTECNSQVQAGCATFRSEVVDVGYVQDDTTAAASSSAGLSVHCPVAQVDASKGSGSIADQAIGDEDKGDVSQMNVAEIETDKTIDPKTRTSGWDLMPPIRCQSSSDMASGGAIRYRNTEKDEFSYKRDRSEVENKERKTFDSRVNGSEVFSRIERSASGRVFHDKDSFIEDDSFFRSERDFGSMPFRRRGRYPVQRGGRGDNPWDDSSLGCERSSMKRLHSPPAYHSGMRSTRNFGGSGDGRRVHSHPYNNGRIGSPSNDRNENNYNMHRGGNRSGSLEISPDRCIGVGRGGTPRACARYGGPSQIDGGGLGSRGRRYHHRANNAAAIENDNVENSSYMHPLSVRGGGGGGRRSFSPPHSERRGNNNQFGPRSQLGSRARSPDAGWQPRANISFRNRSSRSPNFRPRGRSPPFSRPDFAGDQESGGFSLTSMDRDSPPRSKWMHYKQQQQPETGRGNRGWGVDEMMEPNNRKLNNNIEYTRSLYPPTRHHSDFNSPGRIGCRPRYEMNEDDSRKEYRFRQGGGLKRFRYNNEGEENDFGNNSHIHRRRRGTPPNNGETGRRSAEERGHFLHRHDRKYINSKSIGMQESDDDVAAVTPPRRRIW